MKFDNYKNKLDFPRKSHFVTKYFYRQGQVVAVVRPGEQVPAIDLKGCVTESVVNEDAYAVAYQHYNKMDAHLAELFVVDLLHDYGLPDNEFTRALYAVAYSRGHANGLENVYNCFSDLAELDGLAKKAYGK